MCVPIVNDQVVIGESAVISARIIFESIRSCCSCTWGIVENFPNGWGIVHQLPCLSDDHLQRARDDLQRGREGARLLAVNIQQYPLFRSSGHFLSRLHGDL